MCRTTCATQVASSTSSAYCATVEGQAGLFTASNLPGSPGTPLALAHSWFCNEHNLWCWLDVQRSNPLTAINASPQGGTKRG
jgi:hypothetical protein